MALPSTRLQPCPHTVRRHRFPDWAQSRLIERSISRIFQAVILSFPFFSVIPKTCLAEPLDLVVRGFYLLLYESGVDWDTESAVLVGGRVCGSRAVLKGPRSNSCKMLLPLPLASLSMSSCEFEIFLPL